MSDTQATVPSPEHEARPIIVGVDGSESSIEALRTAARLAAALDATLEAIAAWEVPYSMYDAYYPLLNWSPESDARRALNHAASTVFGDEPPAWFTTSTRNGSAARVLIEASRGAQMLVLGTRGHGGFVGLMLGSVSSACAAHAQCPVLVVRHDAENASTAGTEDDTAEPAESLTEATDG